MLGIWKDFEELESNLSMPELSAIMKASREKDGRHQRFLAALQGVDLDAEEKDAVKAFEDVKARVLSGGKITDSNDIRMSEHVAYTEAGSNFSWKSL